MTHTCGPWQRNGSHLYGPDPQRVLIAQMCYIGRGYQEESEANHRLIEAAPELLRRLKIMCREWREAFGGPEENRTPGDVLEHSEELIAKVEGKP